MNGTVSLLFDGAITVLLVAAIAYMAVLNRRLTRLQLVKVELERVLGDFGEATVKAEACIARLKSASAGANQLDKQDRERLDRALGLRDDLAFLLERGTQVADRLEADLRQARDGAPPRSADVTPLTAHRGGAGGPRQAAPQSATEQALLEALQQARS